MSFWGIPDAIESALDRRMVYECDAAEGTTAEGEPSWLVTKVGEVVAGPD